MIRLLFLLILAIPYFSLSQPRTIHVFVALCDNEHQGIAPVPASIGNGKKPSTNLYWGAGYGIKTFFDKKTDDWNLLEVSSVPNSSILERILFKHRHSDTYLLADAYDGECIQKCIEDFLRSSNGQAGFNLTYEGKTLGFGGSAQLMSYIGHNGLMEFWIELPMKQEVSNPKDVMILACISQDYFQEEIQLAKANPLLWTTGLMAPEAYTLKAAIDGWILKESGAQIHERAAQAYHQYQKCGIRGARNLFTTGF
ncbi:MAG: hypothetical protein AAGC85_24155, partial [Bacteroidota bacterium]